ncbi:hypothetical protein D3C72_2365600 [compost metagenome]
MIAPPARPETKRQAKNHATESGQAQAKKATVAASINTRNTVRLDQTDTSGRPSKAPAR